MIRTRSRAWVSMLAVVTGMALVAAACGGDSGGSDTTSESGSQGAPPDEGTPQSGGSATYLHYIDLTSDWDPWTILPSGYPSWGTRGFAVYGALVTEDTRTGEVTGEIAESVDSDDGKTWTVRIRDGVEFSDATPFDAEAVKFNWELAQDPERGAISLTQLSEIESMEATEPLALTVELKEVNFQWPSTVARFMNFIGSPTAIQAEGEDFGTAPVGAGPFLVDEWVPNDTAHLVRNPNYYKEGQPYLDELTIQTITDEQQRFDTFRTDSNVILFTDNDLTRQRARDEGATMTEDTLQGGTSFLFNAASGVFADVRARQAFAIGVDMEAMADVVTSGAGDGVGNLFTEDSPYFDPEITRPEHDPDRAQELWDEVADEQGGPVEFTLLVTVATQPWGEYAQAELANYGVDMKLESVRGNEIIPRMVADDFDVATKSTTFGAPDPIFYYAMLSDSSTNFGYYSNPDMDEAIVAARESEGDAAVEQWKEAQRIFWEDMPNLFYGRVVLGTLPADNVHGIELSTQSLLLSDEVWVDQ